jgi:hypothetical protein
MKISALCVCVDYADLLRPSLARWASGLDDLLVVSSKSDMATYNLCASLGVPCHATDVFYEAGAAFNKAAAMDLALERLRRDEWLLAFDADVVPPADWKARLESLSPACGNLYGAVRTDGTGKRINDGELAGFFQLWHADDPVAQERPLFGSWHNASAYDSEFMRRWPADRRVILPIELEHQGPRGTNWCGRGNHQGMLAMQFERSRRGGYRHERLIST